MTDVTFGGTSLTPFQSSAGTVNESVGVPAGRTMANGSQAVLIYQLLAYIGGYGGTRTVTVSFAGSSASASFASNSNPGGTWLGSSNALANPGTYTFSYSGGPMYGKRGADGSGGSASGSFGSWAAYWAGGYSYVQAPDVPTSVGISVSASQATITWGASGDNGGSAISTYHVQASTSATFSSIAAEADSNTGTYTFTGLTAGLTYYFRVAARNGVTDAAGTYGPWAAAVSGLIPGGVYYGVGGVWKQVTVYYGYNDVWVPCVINYGASGVWKDMAP